MRESFLYQLDILPLIGFTESVVFVHDLINLRVAQKMSAQNQRMRSDHGLRLFVSSDMHPENLRYFEKNLHFLLFLLDKTQF